MIYQSTKGWRQGDKLVRKFKGAIYTIRYHRHSPVFFDWVNVSLRGRHAAAATKSKVHRGANGRFEKKSEFKVGQMVRVVECEMGTAEHTGKIGKIEVVLKNSYGYNVRFKNGDRCTGVKVEPYTPPEKWRPGMGSIYYSPDICRPHLYYYSSWDGDSYDDHRLANGLVFKTKEEAVEMAKKILAVVKEDK